MKLRNEQILNVFSGLNALGNDKFSAKLAWKISTARGALTPFVESVEKSLMELRMQHAIKDDEGNIVPAVGENGLPLEGTLQIAKEHIQTVNKEIMDLLNVEVEVVNVTLSIDDFPETFEVSPNVLQALQPILT